MWAGGLPAHIWQRVAGGSEIIRARLQGLPARHSLPELRRLCFRAESLGVAASRDLPAQHSPSQSHWLERPFPHGRRLIDHNRLTKLTKKSHHVSRKLVAVLTAHLYGRLLAVEEFCAVHKITDEERASGH